MVSNQKAITELIKSISGQANVLTIPRIYVSLTGGDHRAALLLSQSVYWSDKTKRPDGFFFKSYVEWETETGLSKTQVKRAALALTELADGLFETKVVKANGAPTVHYKVDVGLLSNLIITFLDNQETSLSDSDETLLSDSDETSLSLTETTQETTTKTTEKKAAKKPPPAPPPPAGGVDVIDELAPVTPQSVRMFEVINRDRDAKKRGPLKRFASVQQREQTEIALFQIDEAGELETAFNWAMVNGRHARDAFCSAMTKWAQNLGKAPPSKNGYHKQTVFERNVAGLQEVLRQEGINEP